MDKIAERFYYLLDAAGGHSSMTPDSKEAEIENLVGCTSQEFKKAVEYLLNKRVISLDEKGISIIAPLNTKNHSKK